MKVNKKFLNSFKKNDIVIYAIALMLVTAGYFNYTANIDETTLETYSENISDALNIDDSSDDDIEEDDTNIGEAELVNSDDIIEEDIENEDTFEEVAETVTEESEESIEEEVVTDNEDYFASTKLERDQNYASMISTYTEIMEDDSISETQKAIAMNEITEINDIINAISVCENVLSTKGFSNLVVLVNGDSVNVVVSVEGGLTTEMVAQIQNVVSRELSADIENIHITENT